jgi:HAD superfamily hydrolase (TIGR01509 family)
MALRAVIFDFDGVLVNSEPLHFRTLREILLPEGISIDEDEYLHHYLAYDDRGAIRLALERHGIPFDSERVDRIAERKAAIFDAAAAEVPLFPGVRELLDGLAAEMPLAIASGALHGEIETILSSGGLLPVFHVIVGADDVTQGKPHPEPYLTAMAGLEPHAPQLRPEECLVFEDSMPGIAAARAAGMTVVGVTNSYPAARLSAAHRVVESLEGLGPADLRAFVAA